MWSRKLVRSIVAGAVVVAVGWFEWLRTPPRTDLADGPRASGPVRELAAVGGDAVDRAFEQRRSGSMIEFEGVVDRVLEDDREGSRHQRFVLRVPSGRTVLVAHNIDLASRVPVSPGDRVRIRGQYEWNDRGGVVHWTHSDPRGRRAGGWIEKLR